MSDNRSKVSANSKTSNSSRAPVLTYAETANNRSNRSTSSADATQPSAATAAAAGKHTQRPSSNAANGSALSSAASGAPAVSRGNAKAAAVRSRSRDAPVRLPSRNSVSSAAAPPAIQFGSLNQQARPPSPPAAAQRAAPATAAATSGGVPAALAKPASKPSFGSMQSSSEDGAAKPPASNPASSAGSSTADAPARAAQHGRQPQQHQPQHQQRPGSRSSSHSRQSQTFVPGRKDSGSFKHTGPKSGPKPHEPTGDMPHHPPHYDGYHVGQPPTMAMPGPPGPHPQGGMSAQQQPPPHYANYRNQGHPHVRPPHSQSPSGPYKPQAGVHYAPHHMGGQPMPQPMGYGMPAPGQPPMQAPIMTTQPGMQPMAGWMAPPPHQYAYMPMGGPGYEQYYRGAPAAGGPPPPHGMYGMPNYSMPNPTHAMPSQIGGPGIMQGGPMGGMPGMTASPMAGQQQQHHHQGGLSASAQAFVPGRRPVRIVNPNTNEEVDISQQRLRSVSTASSTPQHAASGTASPATGLTVERRESAATPVEAVPAEDDSMPKFKIP
ncbi:hypothetical protein GGI24_000968, partial [Coemansia furcata]